ncbi:MAG: hypothetical protein WDO56_07115 [Gammaproteobacteria bacterium]
MKKLFLLFLLAAVATVDASAAPARFSVEDDAAIATFGSINGDARPLSFSPDGALVAVHVERGLIPENRVKDEVRIYRLEDLRRFANQAAPSSAPAPVWQISHAVHTEGPIISDLRWSADSRGLAFLVPDEGGRRQLWFGDLASHTETALTPAGQNVMRFDVRDRSHFVYTIRTLGSAARLADGSLSGYSAAGRTIYTLLDSASGMLATYARRGELWAATGGEPKPVQDPATGRTIIIFFYASPLVLSPDGNTILTAVTPAEVPSDWTRRFPTPPWVGNAVLGTGHQDLDDPLGDTYTHIYATIDVRSGRTTRLTETPTAISASWRVNAGPAWSADGGSVILPGIFTGTRDGEAPYFAVANPVTRRIETIDELVEPRGVQRIMDARFVAGRSDRVEIDYARQDGKRWSRVFARAASGKWQSKSGTRDTASPAGAVELTVKEDLNERPVLIAKDRGTGKSAQVWDPNPQLADLAIPKVRVYRWKDETGREWRGGLYEPLNLEPGRRYPLVIQTHGFYDGHFRPYGIFTTGYAAAELAGQDILVLQVPDVPSAYSANTQEATDHLQGYVAAIRQLVAEGRVDESRVGILGFSRTCLYVMQGLITNTLPVKAALVIQGVKADYFQYILAADMGMFQEDSESFIGAAPFGDGIKQWLQRSPSFNMEKITAAVGVVSGNDVGILPEWETYALLRRLNKPTDLFIMGTREHVVSGPGVRIAVQGNTVDWFRFWLKDEEDADPAKADQYARWRLMRDQQKANDGKAAEVLRER